MGSRALCMPCLFTLPPLMRRAKPFQFHIVYVRAYAGAPLKVWVPVPPPPTPHPHPFRRVQTLFPFVFKVRVKCSAIDARNRVRQFTSLAEIRRKAGPRTSSRGLTTWSDMNARLSRWKARPRRQEGECPESSPHSFLETNASCLSLACRANPQETTKGDERRPYAATRACMDTISSFSSS